MTLDTILQGDCLEVLKTLPDNSINCCVTSPPYYGLRDYGTGEWVGGNPDCPHRRMSKFSESTITGHFQEELRGNVGDAIYKQICPLCGARREDKQIGLEETPEEYVDKLVQVFREVKRVLKDDGTLWLNIGDSYSGSGHGMNADGSITITDKQLIQQGNKASYMSTPQKKLSGYKPKDLIGIPWLLAFALRNDGWYLRQDIIWHKPNPMPESVKASSHGYIYQATNFKYYGLTPKKCDFFSSSIEVKADNYAKLIRNLESDVDDLDAEYEERGKHLSIR